MDEEINTDKYGVWIAEPQECSKVNSIYRIIAWKRQVEEWLVRSVVLYIIYSLFFTATVPTAETLENLSLQFSRVYKSWAIC